MKQAEHLEVARQNQDLAERLSKADDEASWRWAVVVSFYSANHYVHAAFDRNGDDLPQDETRQLSRGGQISVSYRHPQNWSRRPGGTRNSLNLLIKRHADLVPLADLFDDMFEDSRAARYGLDGSTLTRPTKQEAEKAISRLQSLVSIIIPYLR